MSTTGSTNQVDENSSRSYTFRADLGYSGAGSVDFSLASLGTSDSATNSVVWTDGTTSRTWVNQPVTVLQGGSLTTTAASGSADSTAPTISSMVFAEGSTTTANTLDADDLITITFSEMMDPVSFVSAGTLIPGGSAVAVADGATGDVVLSAAGLVTVTNIATTDVDAGAATASTYTNTLALNSAGTILTVQITVTSSGALSAGEVFGDVTGLTTTAKDVNGTLLADSAVNASGAI